MDVLVKELLHDHTPIIILLLLVAFISKNILRGLIILLEQIGSEYGAAFGNLLKTKKHFRIQDLVNCLLIGLILTQEAVVEITVFGRVYSDEVSTPLVLEDGFNHDLLLLLRQLQKLVQILLLDPIQLVYVLYLRVDFTLYFLDLLVQEANLFLGILRGSLVVRRPLLGLDDADEIESVFDQISLDFEVQGGLECE